MSFDPGNPPNGGWSGPPSSPPGYQPYSQGFQNGGAREHPSGTTVLVLGILSIVICGILGPFAWSMGSKAVKEMDAEPMTTWTNRGNINAGRICGIIGTVLMALGILGFLLVVVAAGAST